ncbi:voltage-gated sodium channel [Dysgonomonas hofstadii]|uniref:Voltage-gated sodium channel n=1 Tax=Dysgonomonas hofstadii TaxID=637886 RepID=A0A840CP49_9BACT|nr:ion transporter [Dysgonomonas hofstadii]MBB4035304.1 voltage-gated sodium channel [Dysgonomonas hofstadii]
MLKLLLNNRFIGGIILFNTLVTILLTFNTPFNGILEITDYLITLLFLIEIIYKIHFYKSDFFKSAANVFDMLLVLLASVSLFLIFSDKNPADYNYILLLRVFKLFKFIRFGKFIPNFSKLLRDFGRAIKASLSLIIGAFIMMVIISTILTYIFKDSYPTLFGNPFESAYTVFRMLTIEGWYEIPDFMVADIPYWSSVAIRVFFSLFVFVGGMLGMSFFTSLIVDELASDNNDELINHVKSLEEKINELYEINKELMNRLK